MYRAIVAIILVGLSASTSYATARWVFPDGSGTYPTIQSAINACNTGDWVILDIGTYTGDGNRDIDFLGKAITVRSTTLDPLDTIIDCEGGISDWHRGFIFQSGEDTTSVLMGVQIRHGFSYFGFGGGILCTGDEFGPVGARPKIDRCLIYNNFGHGLKVFGLTSGPIIRRCTFQDNSGNGIDWSTGDYDSDYYFVDCHFINNTGEGIDTDHMGLDISVYFVDCSFIDNVGDGISHFADWGELGLLNCDIIGNGGYGLSAGGGEDLQIDLQGTEISGNTTGGVWASDYIDLSTDNSQYTDNGGDGIHLTAFHMECLIANCQIERNTGDAVYLAGTVFQDFYIEDCTLCDNGGDGVFVDVLLDPYDPQGRVSMFDCTISGNDRGVVVQCPDPEIETNLDNVIVSFNRQAGMTLDQVGNLSPWCTNIYGNLGGDWIGNIATWNCNNGNFSRDPLFCDVSAYDYTLASMSPCLPPNNSCGSTIGALGQGCSCADQFTDDLSQYIADSDTDKHYGVALGDYDGDGLIDVYWTGNASNGDPVNKLFHTYPGNCNVLEDFTWLNGVYGAGTGRAAKWGDYDNDGDVDLFVANADIANQLFNNDGFYVPWTDEAATAGVDDPAASNGDAAWIDYDQDGDLDLYVTQNGPNRLFGNNGSPGWTFTDVAGTAGVADGGQARSCCWADYDNDGDPDLYVSNYDTSPNKLYRNDGGTFTDVTAGPLGDTNQGNGICWGDYDNDGDLDLYLANYGSANRLFENQGGPGWTFVDVAVASGVDDTGYSRGVAWVDYDNDGDLDLHVSDWSDDHLYRNDGGTFTDVAPGTVIADSRSGRGVAWGDLNNDGLLDCFLANYSGVNRLFQNLDCSGNHWLQVDLIDSDGFRNVIGARVRVVAGGIDQIQEISGGSGYYSQNWMVAHFGLGSETTVDALEIRWPDGDVQTVYQVAVDQRLEVTQGVTQVTEQELPAVPERYALGAAHPNPFNPQTTISYDVPAGGGPVRLRIFDVRGHRVRTLVDEPRPAGRHEVTWDGRGSRGGQVPSGVYFYQLQAGELVETRKMTLVQ